MSVSKQETKICRGYRLAIVFIFFSMIFCPFLLAQKVLTGIDILQEEQFAPIQGVRIGLITNHTGINKSWLSTIDILHDAPEIDLVAIFTPEHGLRGNKTGRITTYLDSTIGLPIYSLYGETHRPTIEMLEGVDALIFDIQDIGTRFYTYIGTMKTCMEEAARNNIAFIVLDRPNPINGIMVEGPLLSSENTFELAGIHELPIRHGMTVGELALLFQGEDQIDLELEVIRMRGWQRSMWFDDTGLPWVDPSPNMRSLTQAILYPGIGLLERLNINNKRGLDRPFEMFGAPWIDGVKLTSTLQEYNLTGVSFIPTRFQSFQGIYANQLCEGVRIELLDREKFQSVHCGIAIVDAIYQLYPNKLELDKLWHLLRSNQIIEAIRMEQEFEQITAIWQDDLERFLKTRGKYLLY